MAKLCDSALQSIMVMFVDVVLRLSRCADLVLCDTCWNIIMLVWFLSNVEWCVKFNLGTVSTTS